MIKTLYDKLSERHYTEYSICQLPGCSEKLVAGVSLKYCTKEHARKARLMYRVEWNKKHKKNIKLWNERYARNHKQELIVKRANKKINLLSNENSQNQVN